MEGSSKRVMYLVTIIYIIIVVLSHILRLFLGDWHTDFSWWTLAMYVINEMVSGDARSAPAPAPPAPPAPAPAPLALAPSAPRPLLCCSAPPPPFLSPSLQFSSASFCFLPSSLYPLYPLFLSFHQSCPVQAAFAPPALREAPGTKHVGVDSAAVDEPRNHRRGEQER
eukprot:768077-Hanusia_phi.AAC.3